jgi:multicomponent Na+:H+ antiporter subunit B
MKKVLSLLLLATLAFITIALVVEGNLLPNYGEASIEERVSKTYITSDNLETGSANAVTSIVTGFRSFDTLGEVTVLFVSALGVSLLVGTSAQFAQKEKSGFILRVGSKAIMPIIMVVAFYVITHGHLSPGGGFQGGAMIASAMLLMALSDEEFMPNVKGFKLLEGFAGTAYVVIGLLGIILSGYFLENFLGTGVVGQLFSAGVIPIVYLFIGLKVGAELTGIITDFFKKEAQI